MKDYKDTLYMGKTDFEMRGNLGKKEPEILKTWDDINLYQKVLEKNKDKQLYTLHDGPPYANGEIHIGHALNKILKDIIVRYKNMNGYKSIFIPGWDTHGLPIENAVIKSGVDRKQTPKTLFREKCRQYAVEQVAKQKQGFKRLGVLADYDNAYITLDKEFEKNQILVFLEMVKKGLIYKGLKPVYWSWSSESALAEAEIEYIDKEDTSIYLKFDIVDNKDFKDTSFVVWTTTPWTLPGNLALCVGSDIDYLLITSNLGRLIVAKDLLENLKTLLELKDVSVINEYKGKDLEHVSYKHPLYDRTGKVILGDFVTTTDGSGIVHIAPGHGEDDFLVCKNYNIEVVCPVDARGIMTNEALQYEGLFYDKCNNQIIVDLNESNHLLKELKILHSYPHDWRTKKPIIFRATPQWFASIDKIKEELLDSIEKVSWNPKWGKIRISNMIKDRVDWCISRQRLWGVPIPVFYTQNYQPILSEEIILHVADLFSKHGSSIWYEKEAVDLLPKGFTHPLSPDGIFYKETDIMDVWFDSGSSHQILKDNNLPYPCDLYLEGSDQYRGWFNSSLITGVSLSGKAPYKSVLSHGFTLDQDGKKMSKSLGNSIDPIKVCNEYGADILRLWVASIEYRQDMPIGKDLLKQVSESYRKIRNTIRFLLTNTSDFNYKRKLPYEKLQNVDKYMYWKLQEFINDFKTYMDNFEFGEVYRLVNSYINNTLSAFYLDFTKDILYVDHPEMESRLSVQTVFYQILEALIKLLSPILPFTMSEAYQYFNDKEEEDVYLTDMPVPNLQKDERIINNFDEFMKIRTLVNKKLEEARAAKIIGKSFNAKLILKLSDTERKLFQALNSNLHQLFIVSQVEVDYVDKFEIFIEEAHGEMCQRCWLVLDEEIKDGLCHRCGCIVERAEYDKLQREKQNES